MQEQPQDKTVVVNFRDLVEDNGKTIEQNNLTKKHNIPVGALVEFKISHWHGGGACEKIHARLWIVSHDRDCDGTPLYTLSRNRVPSSGSIVIQGIALKEYLSQAIINNHVSGITEESLTPIEVTPELEDGYGSLHWEDENE